MRIVGRNSVREVIKTGKNVEKLLIQNGMRDNESREVVALAREMGVKISFADKSVLDKEYNGKHQGFIVYVSEFEYYDFDKLIKEASNNENAFLVILDGVEDPHNLGSIIRVCECGGVDGLIIGKHRSATVTDTVIKISEGSANHLKICKVTNINNALEDIKNAGVWVYGLELGGENLYKSKLNGKIAIVIGGEGTGINRLTKEKCDGVLTIPMLGKVNSLNASVATGVAVFEAVRQRNV